MKATHDPSHDALLQAVLLGDAGPDSPAASELQACEVCREQLRELLATAAELHAAGHEQRAVLGTAAQAVDDTEARALVSRAVRTGLRQRQRQRQNRRLPWQWLALAAALLIGLLVWSQLPGVGGGGGDGGAQNRLMGGQHELWPTGEVTLDQLAKRALSWPGSADARYQVYLSPADDPFDAILDEAVIGNTLRLSPDALAKIRSGGKHYLWRYEWTTGAGGAGVRAGEQEFSLR